MKTLKVKTIFNGMIAFPEKYLRNDLRINLENDYMSLKGKIPTGYSEYFEDKFGRGKYRLIYFKWVPDILKGKFKKIHEANNQYNSLTPEEQYKWRMSH